MNAENIENELKEFLVKRFPALSDGVTTDTSLNESGAIDSLGILEIVNFLGEEFNVEFDDDDFEAENFESVGTLVTLAKKKLS
jgi:acyl carrier protein